MGGSVMAAAVSPQQRHTRAHRCPICDGADGDQRGKGKRCFGWTDPDGRYVYCSREDLAGEIEQGTHGGFAHKMHGPCKCGQTHHAEDRTADASDDFEAVYDYRNEHGTLVFQVVRKFGKRFLQRRPNGVGGWIYKLEGISRVLYKLPELLNDDGDRPVYIVEGEKDVDTLVGAGHTATCNPGGAGKWHYVSEQACKVLEGRDIVIIADADAPGRKHAEDVRRSLEGVAASVRVVEAPAPHKDVTALLEAGGSLEQLVPLSKLQNEPHPANDETIDDRPEIELVMEITPIVDAMAVALERDKDVYIRENAIGSLSRAPGAPLGWRALPFVSLQERLDRCARFFRWSRDKSGKDVKIWSRPPNVECATLKERGVWPNLRALRRIVYAPFLRVDGSVRQTPGYDAASQTYADFDVESFERVADRPSRDDARSALRELFDLFVDFPFRSDADRFVPIALLLSLVGRDAISGVEPMFMIAASTKGTGKTKLVDIVSIIATGRPWSSSPRGFHPRALPEPDVRLSPHPAPPIPAAGFAPRRQCA
ncbi:MAG: hypothetical protein FWD73_08215, partial [Polyangiaceae bacterium]|nr:hypothetical protein [Polyangiaceae bacterium]